MRFTVEAETFALAVASAAPAASRRGTVQILGGSLWRVKDGSLSVTCTDMETTVTASVPCGQGDDGAACVAVPTAAQLKALKALKGETVTVDVGDDGATLQAGSTSCTLNLAAVEDYPQVPEVGELSALDAAEFASTLGSVLAAAGTDESRPVLCGVLFESPGDDTLTLAATDPYRLRVRTMSAAGLPGLPDDANGAHPIVAATSLEIVRKQLGRKGATLTAGVVDGKRYGFRVVSDGLELVTVARCIDGTFPRWRQLVPDSYDGGTIHLDRAGMLATTAKIRALVKTHGNNPLRLEVSGGEMAPEIRLTLDNHDGVKASDVVPFTANGYAPDEPREYGVNPGFWADGLGSFEDDTLSVGLTSPLRPMLLFGERHAGDVADFYLVMPIRLAG